MNQDQQIDPSKCRHPSFYFDYRTVRPEQGNEVKSRFLCCEACLMAFSFSPLQDNQNQKTQENAVKAIGSQLEEELFREFEEFKKNTIDDLNKTLANLANPSKGGTVK